jgi:NAD(P)-dependent dehydrogenase (short-subunit alcohol dehydrogenase family)
VADTTIWISGATYGLGAALAQHHPYADARIVNLDRQPSSDYETVAFDLTRPETWESVREHFERELRGYAGKRAIFLVVGHALLGQGLADKVAFADYQGSLVANFAGPLALATAFYRGLAPGYESGLLLVSSAAARAAITGQSNYGAAKAGIEHWVRVMRAEVAARGWGPWIAALRPGFVDTPSVHESLKLSPELYPRVGVLAKTLARFAVDADTTAKRVWAALPPAGDSELIDFDAQPSGSPMRA